MPEHWLTIVYQYIIGGLFFFGVFGVAVKSGSLDMKSKPDRTTALFLTVGFVFFLTVHVVWTYMVTS